MPLSNQDAEILADEAFLDYVDPDGLDPRVRQSIPRRIKAAARQIEKQIGYGIGVGRITERIDGKGMPLITVYHWPIREVHGVSLKFKVGSSAIDFVRPISDFVVYKEDGQIRVFPSLMFNISHLSPEPFMYSSIGFSIPPFPQIVVVDYSYGTPVDEVPEDLIQAMLKKAAADVLRVQGAIDTSGISSMGVQGASFSFGRMPYQGLIEDYEAAYNLTLALYTRPSIGRMGGG